MNDSVLLVNTRSGNIVHCKDCAALALASPDRLGIEAEELLGLTLPADHNELVARVLTSHWLRVQSTQGRGILHCDGADRWPSLFRCV